MIFKDLKVRSEINTFIFMYSCINSGSWVDRVLWND